MIRWIFLLCCIHYGQAATTSLGYFPDWWPKAGLSTKDRSWCLGASCDCIKNNKCNETIECSINGYCGCPAGHVVQWATAPQPEYRYPASNYWPTGNYYWPYEGALSYRGFNCLLCPAGKYSNSASGTWCNSCKRPVPGGGINGEWDISLRDVGYSAAGSSGCSATCPNNTYMIQASSDSNACLDTCPVNTYILPDQKRCIKCSSGKYLIQPYFSNGANESFWCKYCPGGWHPEKVSGSVKCIECAAGRWTDKYPLKKNGLPNCLSSHYDHQNDSPACTVGKYGTPGAINESGCVSCPTGFYQGQIASSTCNECAENKSTGVLTGATNCNLATCSNGYLNLANCEKCPEGHYLNHDGDSSCKQCSRELPRSDGTSCYRCLPGKHRKSCQKCPAGRYTGWEAVILPDCRLCSNGYQDEEGQGNCKICPAGRISSDDRTTCVTCPMGEYSDAENLIECKTCSTTGQQHTGIIGQQIAVCTTGNTKGAYEYNTTGLGVDDPTLASGTRYGYQASLNEVVMNGHTTFKTTCAANKYQNTFDGSCKECPVGLYKEIDPPSLKIVGPNDFNVCKFCPAGESYYSDRCMKCAEILLNSWSSQQEPPHDVNRFALDDFPREPCSLGNCPAGSFAQNGECSECPAGTYWESKSVRGIPYDGSMEYSILQSCDQMGTGTQFHSSLTAAQRTSKKEQCELCYANPSTTLIDMGENFCGGISTTRWYGNYDSEDELEIYANGAANPGNTLEEERDACETECRKFISEAQGLHKVPFGFSPVHVPAGKQVSGFIIWVQEGPDRGKCYCAVKTDLSLCTIDKYRGRGSTSAKYRTYSFNSPGCQTGKKLRTSTTSYAGLCRSCPVGQYQDSTGQVTCKSCSTATTGSATSC